MKDHQGEFVVEKMCHVFEVSRSTYYDWLTRKPSRLTIENEVLKAEIIAIHQLNKGRLGSPKITFELIDRGFQASRPRVARLMKHLGIKSIICKKFRVMTTDSNHAHIPSENLLNRDFTASEPGKKWVSDLTYIKTLAGWLYLTIIMDLYDRKIIGWAMSETMDASCTVIAAFKMAVKKRPVNPFELIFHSDRGIQYACGEFRNLLKAYKINQSMSRKGNCWDNAVAESFFKIIKSEMIYHTQYQDQNHAKTEIFEFIEIWYNVKRKHSYLNYLTPNQFGETNKTKAA
jgi:transposase InsO family protein